MNREAPPPAEPRPELLGCLEACRRCQDVVRRVREAEDAAARAVYARVGPHLRHCLDHFLCLFRALDGDGEIDYDARERNPGIESDPARFAAAMTEIEARVRDLDESVLDREVRVRQAVAPGGRQAASTSNLARELVFLSGHTIHHLAIVGLLCEAGGVPVPEDTTMAFSTEAYRADMGSGAG